MYPVHCIPVYKVHKVYIHFKRLNRTKKIHKEIPFFFVFNYCLIKGNVIR